MVRRLSTLDADFACDYAALLSVRGERLHHAEDAVQPVIEDVRRRGVDALIEATARFDGVALAPGDIRVPVAEIDAAVRACPSDLIEALQLAADRIRAHHDRQRPQNAVETDSAGVTTGWRWTPVDAAGLYAPGGLAAYPSAVLMNAIPAKVAGVRRLVMATPPARLADNPAILAAARIAEVDEVWRIGGAQAIAALAYGAGPLQPCDVVVGPGNAYVTAAKKLVFGDVGIDSIAGPSEVFVVADASAPPEWIAADLLAQAEHDPDAQAVLITDDADFAQRVERAVAEQLASQKAGPSARSSWEKHGAIILVRALSEAPALIDQAAPEHVQIATADPGPLADRIRHAGAIFLGVYAPEALGDYLAGPNHVLPTSGKARFASGLSTWTFMKRTSLIGASRAGLAAVGAAAARIADAEGLPAHAASLRLRIGDG